MSLRAVATTKIYQLSLFSWNRVGENSQSCSALYNSISQSLPDRCLLELWAGVSLPGHDSATHRWGCPCRTRAAAQRQTARQLVRGLGFVAVRRFHEPSHPSRVDEFALVFLSPDTFVAQEALRAREVHLVKGWDVSASLCCIAALFLFKLA